MNLEKKSFYELDVKQTVELLETSEEGLSEAEAADRLTKFGKNELVEKKKKLPLFFSKNSVKLSY